MTTPPTPTTLYVSSIRLTALLTAVSVSRAFIRQTLAAWQLADQIDGAEVVVSELVTNAVKQTGITDPKPTWTAVRAEHIIGVQLRLVDGRLFVEVWDRGDGAPRIPDQSPDAEDGRGLFLVQSLSARWGIHRSAVGGKVVWSELMLPGPVSKPLLAEGLPQRDPGTHGPVAGAELELVDMALMQRVLDGLRSAAQHDVEAVAV